MPEDPKKKKHPDEDEDGLPDNGDPDDEDDYDDKFDY